MRRVCLTTFAYCSLIISSSGRSTEDITPSSDCPLVHLSVFLSVCKHFLVIASPPRPIFKIWSECSLQCKIVHVPKNIPVRRQTCLQTDRQLERQTNGWTDRQTDAGEIHLSKAPLVYLQKKTVGQHCSCCQYLYFGSPIM